MWRPCLCSGVGSETRPAETRADSRGIAAIRVGFGEVAKDFVGVWRGIAEVHRLKTSLSSGASDE